MAIPPARLSKSGAAAEHEIQTTKVTAEALPLRAAPWRIHVSRWAWGRSTGESSGRRSIGHCSSSDRRTTTTHNNTNHNNTTHKNTTNNNTTHDSCDNNNNNNNNNHQQQQQRWEQLTKGHPPRTPQHQYQH